MESEKSGVGANVISLPEGGGAMQGLGETFSADLFSGTGNYSVPIAVPKGRHGMEPQLSLAYSTGNGNGICGQGWNLSLPGIMRKTSLGVPQFRDEQDIFVLSGAEDLIPVEKLTEDDNGVVVNKIRYRPRTEGLFAKIWHVKGNDDRNYWEVKTKDGKTSFYGNPNPASPNRARLSDPEDSSKIFGWKLYRTIDPMGNEVLYSYTLPAQEPNDFPYSSLYLNRILYANYNDNGTKRYLCSVKFNYQDRPDIFSRFNSGFEIRTDKRLTNVETYTHPLDADLPNGYSPQAGDNSILVKRYQLTYRDETSAGSLSNGVSQLAKVQMEGHGPDGSETMPPVEFSYSEFDGSSRELITLNERHLPALSLSDPSMNLVDLDGNGLPDLVEMRPGTPIRYWKNKGRGKFDRPRLMNEAPLGLSVEAGAAQFMDADGDGRADLVINTPREKGYYSLRFDGEWDADRYVRYETVPTVDFSSNDLKYMDLTGDGRTDLIVNSDRAFDCYFQNSPLVGDVGSSKTGPAKPGWSDRVRVRKQSIEDFPDVNFADPRIRTADLSGDGLQDIVMITSGGVFYWPNLGYGNFGSRRLMKNSPRPGFGFDPDRVILADINGDGLTDYVYINVNSVDYYINQSGKGWGEIQTVRATPRFTSRNAIHVVDLMGTGTAGLLWSYNAGESRDRMYFLDLTKGQKPYLLNEVKNNLGAITKVEYTPSTEFYLRDYYGDYSGEFNFVDPVGKWKTTLPFPTLTVSKVEAIDLISKNKLTTRYFYHHGYWDGVEREFRGFGRVDQFDTETFDGYNAEGLLLDEDFTGITTEEYSPPVYTKNWFHLGPVEKLNGDWGEVEFVNEYWEEDQQMINRPPDFFAAINGLSRRAKRDAYRTLRGTALRSELFAKDGSPNRDRPYSVKETQNTIRIEDSPELNETIAAFRTQRHSNFIFFPFQYGGRETAWERGTEPKTSFSFTGELDEFGQPLSNLSIAVPRGKDPFTGNALPGADSGASSKSYHVVLSTMNYAEPDNETTYIVDRVAETKSEEITGTAAVNVFSLRTGAFSGGGTKRILSHQLNYYDGNAFEGLAIGDIGIYGLLVKSESLVITPTERDDIYDLVPPCFNSGATPTWNGYPTDWSTNLPDPRLGYAFKDGNTAPYLNGYYAEGERLKYDIQDGTAANRGNVLAMRDTYDRETIIDYDDYDLMATKVIDTLGMEVSSTNDYRLLAPLEMTDPNDNLTRVAYNELGLVAAMYQLGKASATEGDVYDPTGSSDSPGQIFEYKFNDFLDSGIPISVVKTVREHHAQKSYNHPDSNATIQSAEYSDGYGRIVQSRTQAEDVLYGNSFLGDSGLTYDMSASVGNAIGNTNSNGQNVVVSGKKRYNNKGEVVEQYEPYFGTDFDFGEESTQPGVTIKMYYDALGRLVKTKNPDDSEQRVYFGIVPTLNQPDNYIPTPWERYTYDANDLAGITNSGGNTLSTHHYTPKSELIDALGRVIETTEHQAHYDASNQIYQDVVMKYQYDIKGQLTQVTNANNVVQTINKFDTAGNQLYTNQIDRGIARLTVDAKGMPYFTVDARGAVTLSLYDDLDRPIKMWARDIETESISVRNQTVYGDGAGLTNPENQNLKGKPYQVYDGAGRLTFNAYDFKGNLLEKTRKVIKDNFLIGKSKYEVTWGTLDTSKLGSSNFKTNTVYDALNRAIEVTYPQDKSGGRKKLHPEYNKAGALEKLKFNGATALSQLAYNAKGQRTMMVAAGLMTRYAYDPETFRLTRIRAEKFSKTNLDYKPLVSPSIRLDRGYSYDLMGSVTGIHDKTPGDSNSFGPVDKQWVYSHDPLRRLISATGREHTHASYSTPWQDIDFPNSSDITATNDYLREYAYDKQGNILRLKHTAVGHTGNGFTRYFNKTTGYTTDNLLNTLTIGDDPNEVNFTYSYDANGNMIQENTDRYFEWNYADKLAFFKRQAGTSDPTIWVHYLYDNEGNRVKKFVNKTGGVREVTIYIDGIYEYTYRIVGTAVQANHDFNTLHIMDGSSRIATVRVGNHAADQSPAQKYFVEDHLGNASVVVKTDGLQVNLEEYYPFGESSFGSYQYKRYRYNGKEKDEHTGLYEYGQRYYAPWLCRFVSVDPVAESFPHLSSYNYASNRPVTARDLEGLQANDEGGNESTQGSGDQVISMPIINAKLKSEFGSFMSSRSAQEVPSQNESSVTNLSISEGDNTKFNTSQIEALAESKIGEMNQDQQFRDTFGGIEPLKFDFSKLNTATLKPQNFEKFLSPFDRKMHGSMRAGAKVYLAATTFSGVSGLAAGGTRALFSGSLRGGLSKINNQVALNSFGNAAFSGGAELFGQYIFTGGQSGEIDYFDVAASGALKSTFATDILKAGADFRTSTGFTDVLFTGEKDFSQSAIELSVSIGMRVSPLNSSSISREFGISSSFTQMPISRVGQFGFQTTNSIIGQGATQTLKKDLIRE